MEKTTVLALNNDCFKLVKKLLDKKSKNESTAKEFEEICNKLSHENRVICESVCEIMLEYDEQIDTAGACLNALISSFSRCTNQNYDLIADGIFKLVSANFLSSNYENIFGIIENPHPAILILNSNDFATKMMYLSQKIDELYNSSDRCIKANASAFFRPVFFMIFCCDIVYSESRSIWRTLLKSKDSVVMNEILTLFRINSVQSCMLHNCLISEYIEEEPNISNYLILLCSTKYMAQNSLDITKNVQTLRKYSHLITDDNPAATNIVLFLLAETLQNLSISAIPCVADFLEYLIIEKKLGEAFVLHMILDGLIQALAYPSYARTKMATVEKLLNYIHKSDFADHKRTYSKDFELKFLSKNSDLVNAYSLCIFFESGQELKITKTLTEQEKNFWTSNHLVLRSKIHKLDDNWNVNIPNIIEISKINTHLKTSLVMPLIFKMSNCSDPQLKISILQNMTQLGVLNEIFSTIKALSPRILRSMSIELHLRVWKADSRTYPFLYKLLVERSGKDKEDAYLNVVRAAAIKEICTLKPQHGTDLISLISEILNESLETKETEIAAAVSIDSIVLLCQNHIINITSTWKAISLTSRYEKRSRVVKSLCKFFSIVPQYKRNNLEYENLMKEILGRLFQMIQWSDTHGKHCALEALKSWNCNTMLTLDMMPEIYRENIPIPQAPSGMEVSIFDLEVPGECFVQMLIKIDPGAMGAAANLMSHYIAQEISEYRSGHYLVKEGQPEPTNYKTLPKHSLVRAFAHFIMQQATTKKKEKIVEENVLIEALKILSQSYSRPLPPLNWCFLHDLLQRSDKVKAQCIKLAAKQSTISGTAKRLVENFLINIDETNDEDLQIALNSLSHLCNGMSAEILHSFLDRVSTIFERTIIDEKVLALLSCDKDISNRDNLVLIISIYLKKRDPVSRKIIQKIPQKVLDMTQVPMTQKIQYRCEILAANYETENAIGWLNELIFEQYIKNQHRELLINSISYMLIKSTHFPKFRWLNEFIMMTQNKIIEKSSNVEDILFLIDIFIVSIISMSGEICILTSNNTDIYSKRYHLFAKCFELLFRRNDEASFIFEFIFFVISQKLRSDKVQEAFKDAIIMSRNHSHFKKLKVWHKNLQAIVL